jgi:hypothetical protein
MQSMRTEEEPPRDPVPLRHCGRRKKWYPFAGRGRIHENLHISGNVRQGPAIPGNFLPFPVIPGDVWGLLAIGTCPAISGNSRHFLFSLVQCR